MPATIMRKVRFWLSYGRRNLDFLTPTILSWLARRIPMGSYKGIHIFDAGPKRADGFVERTIEALQIIERIDPRRFRRIQREVSVIINSPLTSAANYGRIGRRCNVDFKRFKFNDNPEW